MRMIEVIVSSTQILVKKCVNVIQYKVSMHFISSAFISTHCWCSKIILTQNKKIKKIKNKNSTFYVIFRKKDEKETNL